MGTSITFKRPDGKDANGYLANAARGNAPGVVVIQEWWGLSDQIKGLMNDPDFPVSGQQLILPADDAIGEQIRFNLEEQINTGMENRLELGQQQLRTANAGVAADVAKNNLATCR